MLCSLCMSKDRIETLPLSVCTVNRVWLDPMASSIVARQLAGGGGGPDVVSEEIVFILTVAGVLVIQYVPFDMLVHYRSQDWHVPLTLLVA